MAYISCSDCDQIHIKSPIPEGSQIKCTRCGATLYRNPADSLNRTLALALTGLILFFFSNLYPFLALTIQGQEQQTVLLTGIIELYNQGLGWLAVLVFLTIILLPLMELIGLIYLLIPLRMNIIPPQLPVVIRMIHRIHHWSMVDVFMLGILVSMVKLASMAEVFFGLSFYSYMALIFVLSATIRSFSQEAFWRAVDQITDSDSYSQPVSNKAPVSCHCCGLLCVPPEKGNSERTVCPRCHARLHYRLPNSINRTWAFVITAFILYIPANIFPISKITSLAGVKTDTIVSSVIYFFRTGMIPIGLVILIASILVPLLKLVTLTSLLLSIQLGTTYHPKKRMTLYRLIEAMGRWSMVDVYVVTILIALVKSGNIATIEAGPGIVFFASVVVISMIAVISFDPRLIWDTAGLNETKHKF